MKRLLWVFFGGLGLIVLAGIIVAARQEPPISSGPLALPDGAVVRVVGVTYGTNHFVGRPLARLVAHTPAAMQIVLKRLLGSKAVLLGSTTTSDPMLVVWLGNATTNATPPTGSGYLNLSGTSQAEPRQPTSRLPCSAAAGSSS
jgi:hypothetical protein